MLYHNGNLKPELFTGNNSKIFVFGSNLAGRHGAGAAKFALNYCGAIYGQGVGLQGNSYALPTLDGNLKQLQLSEISDHIKSLILCAASDPDTDFYITAVGTGLAGFTKEQIAPMFKGAPENCIFPIEWEDIIESEDK